MQCVIVGSSSWKFAISNKLGLVSSTRDLILLTDWWTGPKHCVSRFWENNQMLYPSTTILSLYFFIFSSISYVFLREGWVPQIVFSSRCNALYEKLSFICSWYSSTYHVCEEPQWHMSLEQLWLRQACSIVHYRQSISCLRIHRVGTYMKAQAMLKASSLTK